MKVLQDGLNAVHVVVGYDLLGRAKCGDARPATESGGLGLSVIHRRKKVTRFLSATESAERGRT